MKDRISEDDSSDHFDFGTLNIPDPVPVDLTGRVQELIDEQTISAQNILDLHAAVTHNKGNFADVLEQVVEIITGSDYYSSFEDLLKLYKENPLHLLFMSNDDLTGLVLDNHDNHDIVLFGIKHYQDDIDVEEIREQLGGNEQDTASLMEFDLVIGTYDDDPVDGLGDNHDSDE